MGWKEQRRAWEIDEKEDDDDYGKPQHHDPSTPRWSHRERQVLDGFSNLVAMLVAPGVVVVWKRFVMSRVVMVITMVMIYPLKLHSCSHWSINPQIVNNSNDTDEVNLLGDNKLTDLFEAWMGGGLGLKGKPENYWFIARPSNMQHATSVSYELV